MIQNMKYLHFRLIVLSIFCLLSSLTSFSRSLEPNKLMKDTTVSVIDTVKARMMFDQLKPTLLRQIDELNNKRSICERLINSKKKKAESDLDKTIIEEAYNYALEANPNLRKYKTNNPQYWTMLVPVGGPLLTSAINSGRDGRTTEIRDKDVTKGKLSDNVRTYLSMYENHLSDNIRQLNHAMNNNWMVFVKNPPTKLAITQIENQYYRGFYYDDNYTLDRLDKSAMIDGIEYLFSGKGKYERESYPTDISYLRFKEIPQYRVTYDEDHNDKIGEVYDNKGNLVLIPYIDRDAYDVFKEMKRLVYVQDFKNNKYNIKSENQHTQKFLNLWIGRKNGFRESQSDLASMQAAVMLTAMFGSQRSAESVASKALNKVTDYRDTKGEQFLNQLEIDHSEEFGYIYSIERLSNKQFKIVYLNKATLSPSISAIVTYFTGDKPYTSTFSVELCNTTSQVPPVIRR